MMVPQLILFIVFIVTPWEMEANNELISIKQFESKYVTERDIFVRLPDSYNEEIKYPVLYMHDGQMLFSTLDTWNGQSWRLDEVIDSLVLEGAIEDIILVGISSVSQERHSNYFPEKPFNSLESSYRDSLRNIDRYGSPMFGIDVNSDDYLKFIVYELKPYIDNRFSTLSDVSNTFIAGSSMGGLISMYAFFEYPEIFGGAACISTHWIGSFSDNSEIPDAFYSYLDARKESVSGRKLYFDIGTATLDQYYPVHQRRMDQIFRSVEESIDFDFSTEVYEGEPHTEIAWSKRVHEALTFLLAD
ncbi:MAG: alpha/beta hydrolase [Balneola sp.]|nr:MAG: alpha/beta hydrolase [Balneola sp.]